MKWQSQIVIILSRDKKLRDDENTKVVEIESIRWLKKQYSSMVSQYGMGRSSGWTCNGFFWPLLHKGRTVRRPMQYDQRCLQREYSIKQALSVKGLKKELRWLEDQRSLKRLMKMKFIWRVRIYEVEVLEDTEDCVFERFELWTLLYFNLVYALGVVSESWDHLLQSTCETTFKETATNVATSFVDKRKDEEISTLHLRHPISNWNIVKMSRVQFRPPRPTAVGTDYPRSPSLSVGPLFFYLSLSSLRPNWSGSRMAGGGVFLDPPRQKTYCSAIRFVGGFPLKYWAWNSVPRSHLQTVPVVPR